MEEITWQELHKQLYECKKCARYLTRQIDAPFFGFGNLNADLMFIGEGPGYQTRQKNGIVFCGNRSGDFFLHCLEKNDLHLGNVYITNTVKCQKRNNERPSDNEQAHCLSYLQHEINLVKPKIIVAVGRVAENILHQYGYMERYTIIYLFHPAYILRNGGDNKSSSLYFDYLKKIKNIKEQLKGIKDA